MSAKSGFSSSLFTRSVLVKSAAATATALLAAGAAAGLGPAASAATVCSTSPSSCGYPDATNTGVPSGRTLQTVPGQVSSGPGWYYDTRGWVQVTGNGANLTGLYIPYNVNISASNVTLNDDEIMAGGANSMGVSLRHTSGVTIENTTITGINATSGRLMTGIKDVFSDSTGLVVNANNISNFETGVQLEAGLVENNYIHDPGYMSADHTNGVMSNGDNTPLTITHNTIFNSLGQTDDIALFQDFSGQANRTITNNLLGGGAYSIYGGATNEASYGVPTNITVTGNRIATNYFANGGAYGPVAYFDSSGTGSTWSGNTWDATGATIPSP
ncbi:MAG TPA: hypothetical protein VN767_23130 [Streptosporangiaceae bacterium]|jgi:hypothetical protein|nr:hypothetical protein [Streptosporangiaceae bacterium]